MDVIIEGQIDQEETIADVIATVVGVKGCNTPILRLNDGDSDLSGRILFSHGGFILGGKLNQGGTSGYEAIRQLLSIQTGNYAILDPLRKPTSELNQALWLSTDKIIQALPNLPATEESLADKRPERFSDSAARPKTGQIDIAPQLAGMANPRDEGGADSILKGHPTGEHRQITSAKSPSRRYNENRWRTIKFVVQMTVGLGLCFLIMNNSSTMWETTVKIGKSVGCDLENNALFVGFQNSMENWGKQKAESIKQQKKGSKGKNNR